jgi:hypothetical protein
MDRSSLRSTAVFHEGSSRRHGGRCDGRYSRSTTMAKWASLALTSILWRRSRTRSGASLVDRPRWRMSADCAWRLRCVGCDHARGLRHAHRRPQRLQKASGPCNARAARAGGGAGHAGARRRARCGPRATTGRSAANDSARACSTTRPPARPPALRLLRQDVGPAARPVTTWWSSSRRRPEGRHRRPCSAPAGPPRAPHDLSRLSPLLTHRDLSHMT